MAYQNALQTFTLPAGADLSAAANQYKFVKLDASGNAILCAGVTDKLIGVLQNTPANGDGAVIGFSGVSKVQAGGALAIAAVIGTTAAGLAVAIVAGTDTTQYVAGIVLEASAASGGYVTALIDTAAPRRAA